MLSKLPDLKSLVWNFSFFFFVEESPVRIWYDFVFKTLSEDILVTCNKYLYYVFVVHFWWIHWSFVWETNSSLYSITIRHLTESERYGFEEKSFSCYVVPFVSQDTIWNINTDLQWKQKKPAQMAIQVKNK